MQGHSAGNIKSTESKIMKNGQKIVITTRRHYSNPNSRL